MRIANWAIAAGGVLSIACSQPSQANGVVCTALFAYGLSVTVVDSASGSPAGAGATVVARDGAYADSATGAPGRPEFPSFSLAGERAGTYSISVTRPGYKPWSRSGVEVTKDVCHVRGVAITAKLQPGS